MHTHHTRVLLHFVCILPGLRGSTPYAATIWFYKHMDSIVIKERVGGIIWGERDFNWRLHREVFFRVVELGYFAKPLGKRETCTEVPQGNQCSLGSPPQIFLISRLSPKHTVASSSGSAEPIPGFLRMVRVKLGQSAGGRGGEERYSICRIILQTGPWEAREICAHRIFRTPTSMWPWPAVASHAGSIPLWFGSWEGSWGKYEMQELLRKGQEKELTYRIYFL